MENKEKAKYQTIEPAEALQLVAQKEDFYLIDVRTDDEYSMGHLKQSVNIPLDVIGKKANKAFKSKDSKIVLYCKSGARSRLACTELIYLGYSQVFDLGGIISYPYEFTTN
jgi:rhodanese-related sulfurtransferase